MDAAPEKPDRHVTEVRGTGGALRTALICSEASAFNRQVLPGWLTSFSDLAGIVVIKDSRRRLWQRAASEWKRSRWRIIDVVAFRLFYRFFLRRKDQAWIRGRVQKELDTFPTPTGIRLFETDDPNSQQTQAFLQSLHPDLVLAACKTILRPEIFDVARHGTYVVHPGICPEYRNAHGCFWALARRDLERVGATLLRIDQGVDTGPVFAYYTTDFDERRDSHVVIQHRVVYDNLDRIALDLRRISAGQATPLPVAGRASAAWGQPRLSDYLRWKRAARRQNSP
jgi:hypothetical protein